MISAESSTKKSRVRQEAPNDEPEPAVKPRLRKISGSSTIACHDGSVRGRAKGLSKGRPMVSWPIVTTGRLEVD